MAKFRFKLEPLLDQRRNAERQKQLAVAELQRQRLDFEERITAAQRELRGYKADLRTLLGGGAGANGGVGSFQTTTVRLQMGASLHAQARTQRLALQLAGVYKRLEGARAELINATKARRAVELLKERRFDEWRAAEKRRETNEIDEIATIRGAARGSPDGSFVFPRSERP